jgi:hypothetical protein
LAPISGGGGFEPPRRARSSLRIGGAYVVAASSGPRQKPSSKVSRVRVLCYRGRTPSATPPMSQFEGFTVHHHGRKRTQPACVRRAGDRGRRRYARRSQLPQGTV